MISQNSLESPSFSMLKQQQKQAVSYFEFCLKKLEIPKHLLDFEATNFEFDNSKPLLMLSIQDISGIVKYQQKLSD